MRCKVCGHQAGDDAKFCSRCGSRVGMKWRFSWFEAAWLTGMAFVVWYSVSAYSGRSPYIVGKWSGTPAVMPEGLMQTAGRFARLNITGSDANGDVTGTLSVDGPAYPVAGTLWGHHLSLVTMSSALAAQPYYGFGFEGTLRGSSLDGTLTELGASQWNRPPISFELSLVPDQS